jgi:hypothetical protein
MVYFFVGEKKTFVTAHRIEGALTMQNTLSDAQRKSWLPCHRIFCRSKPTIHSVWKPRPEKPLATKPDATCQSPYSSLPEFIDPRFRENKPKTLVFSHWKRAFWACFRKNCVFNFGHLSLWLLLATCLLSPSSLSYACFSPCPLSVPLPAWSRSSPCGSLLIPMPLPPPPRAPRKKKKR